MRISLYPSALGVRLLGAWVLANALAEMIGLGASALLWMAGQGVEASIGIVASAVLVALASTLLEGAAVGVGQWLALRRPFSDISLRSWWVATTLGALAAWSLGMIPSTLMSLRADAAETVAPSAMPDVALMALAAGMGVVLGPILAFPQWVVLRRHVQRAWIWIPANAAAWGIGMVIVFAAAGNAPAGASWPAIAAFVLAALAAAGAVVGAVHGLALVNLVSLVRPKLQGY